MDTKVLIVEDEKELGDILGAYLQVEGYQTINAYDGEEGKKAFYEQNPSLILLDIMLPKLDGIELCKEIRKTSDAPIIMISAKSGEMDKVIALGVGADDYVTKPYSPLELVARVKANLRRYSKGMPEIKKDDEISMGCLKLNHKSYTAIVGNEELTLTTKEFEMLYYLMKNKDLVLTKEQIYKNVWGYQGACDDNSVTVYIKRLREKMTAYDLDYIKTVWGAGYKFCE